MRSLEHNFCQREHIFLFCTSALRASTTIFPSSWTCSIARGPRCLIVCIVADSQSQHQHVTPIPWYAKPHMHGCRLVDDPASCINLDLHFAQLNSDEQGSRGCLSRPLYRRQRFDKFVTPCLLVWGDCAFNYGTDPSAGGDSFDRLDSPWPS